MFYLSLDLAGFPQNSLVNHDHEVVEHYLTRVKDPSAGFYPGQKGAKNPRGATRRQTALMNNTPGFGVPPHPGQLRFDSSGVFYLLGRGSPSALQLIITGKRLCNIRP